MAREYQIPTEGGEYRVLSPVDISEGTARAIFESGQTPPGWIIEPVAPAQPGAQAYQPTSVIRNEPSTFRKIVEQIPPLAGLAAGSAVGWPLGPVTGLAGAGLGYAAGNQAVRLGRSVEDWLTAPPEAQAAQQRSAPSIGQQAARIGGDVATGAALEAVPPIFNAFGKGLANLAGLGPATLEDIAVQDAAKRQGIAITASTKSGSAPIAQLETFPARFPIGRQTADPSITKLRETAEMAAQRAGERIGAPVSLETAGQTVKSELGGIGQAQQDAVGDYVSRYIDTLGTGRQGTRQLGASVQEGLKTTEKAARAKAADLYKAAMESGGDGTVPLGNLRQEAIRLLEVEKRMRGVQNAPVQRTAGGLTRGTEPPPLRTENLTDEQVAALLRQNIIPTSEPLSVQSLPQAFIEEFNIATVGERPLADVVSLQQRLRSLIRNTKDDFTRKTLGNLAEAVTKDIDEFAVGTPVGDQLRQASTVYRREVAEAFSQKGGLRKAQESRPAAAAKKLLDGDADTWALMQRNLPPEKIAEVQRAVMNRVYDQSLMPNPQTPTDVLFNPGKFEKQLTAIGDEKLSILFGAQFPQLQALRKSIASGFGRGAASENLSGVLGTDAPRVVQNLARGRNVSMERLNEVVANLTPQAREEMGSSLFQDVLNRSYDPGTGLFSMERYQSAKAEVPKGVWDLLVTGAAKGDLRDIDAVFHRANQYNRISANPSQTGQSLMGAQQIGTATQLAGTAALGLATNPTTALIGLLAPSLVGKAVFSGPGQRFLTKGPLTPYNPQGTWPSLQKLLGVSLVPKEEDRRP